MKLSKWRCLVLAFSSVFLMGAPTLAQVVLTYETGGKTLFSVEAPDNWNITTGSNINPDPKAPAPFRKVVRVVGMLPEGDPRVWVGLFSPEGVQNISEGEDYVRNLDKKIVSDAKLLTKTDTKFGGRKARVYRGTGKRERNAVDFSITLVDLPGRRIAVAVMLGEQGARAGYETQLKQIADSFRVRN